MSNLWAISDAAIRKCHENTDSHNLIASLYKLIIPDIVRKLYCFQGIYLAECNCLYILNILSTATHCLCSGSFFRTYCWY